MRKFVPAKTPILERPWFSIPCQKSDLNLDYTLGGGQTFRWQKIADNEWWGVFCHKFWILKQTDNLLLYKVEDRFPQPNRAPILLSDGVRSGYMRKYCAIMNKKVKLTEEEKSFEIVKDDSLFDGMILCRYLRLEVNLEECYKRWSDCDPVFRKAARNCTGVRLLRQDPFETIFAFICSSNNNISRITQMMDKLCSFFGMLIVQIGDKKFYDFPELNRLIHSSVWFILVQLSFGYRAEYIHKSACMIDKLGGYEYIKTVYRKSYEDAKEELLKLPGVGPKIADCICLMGFGHDEVVPVDTHIYKVCQRYYLTDLPLKKSLPSAMYQKVTRFFQRLHGRDAGWAQAVLFCSDLSKPSNLGTAKGKKRKSEEN